jgi:hypothetical protein
MRGAQVGLQGVQAAQAGYGMAGQMGRTLADIGTAQQAADISRMDLQSRLGAAQQTREQALIDQAIRNYQMAREYPYEQLSRYSGLLRGYYTPTTTQTTYQAYSPMSQLAGAGTAAYALSQMNRKEGGQIKEKKYAKGGILDAKVFNDPTSFSPEMIKKGMQNDSISDMIGAIGLSQIVDARKRAQQNQALSKAAPQGTVLGDLQQQVAGIDSLPSNLPVQSMAGGGIIAFEDGGEVIRASNGLPQDMFTVNPYLADYIREKETGGLRDRDAAVSPKGARGIMQIMPATAMKPGFGVPTIFDLADQAGVEYKGRTEDEAKRLLTNRNLNVAFGEQYAGAMQKKFGDNPVLAAAAYNAGPGAVERAGGVPNIAETQKYVAGISPERFAAASESVRSARRAQMGLSPLPAKPAPAQPIPGAAAAIEQVGDITARGVAEDRQRQFMDILAGRAPVPKRATPNDPTLMAEAAPPGLPSAPKPAAAPPTPEAKPEEDSDIAALRKSIAARRGELGKQREQDKYMALLAAGLGMMSGTSVRPLENIGKGALQGVAALQASRKEQREAEQDVLASELGLSRATLYEKMRVDQLKSNKEIAAAKNAISQQLADIRKQQGYRDAADMWLNSPNRTALEADLQKRYGKNWKQDGKADLELSMARTKFIQELLSGGGLFGGNVQQANALLAR